MAEWGRRQVRAAENAGQKVVLQPVTNLNEWSGGVEAFVGMKVRLNPEYIRVYKHPDTGRGTVVGPTDSNSEVLVAWECGDSGAYRAGKCFDFWLMTDS